MNKKFHKEVQQLEIYHNLLEKGVIDITTEKDLKKGNIWFRLPISAYEIPPNKKFNTPYDKFTNIYISKTLNVYFMIKTPNGEYIAEKIYQVTSSEIKHQKIPLIEKYTILLKKFLEYIIRTIEGEEYFIIDINNDTFIDFILKNYSDRLDVLLRYEDTVKSALELLYMKGYLGPKKSSIERSQIF